MERGEPFTDPWLWELWHRWLAYCRGFGPGREPVGYGGFPPNLLRAFEVLDIANHRAQLKRGF